jgi:hypothetical protein
MAWASSLTENTKNNLVVMPLEPLYSQYPGRVAQLVERWSNKPLVLGSIPNVTTFFSLLFSFCFAPITCTTTGAPLCGWGARVGCTRWALLCSFLFFFISFFISFFTFLFPTGRARSWKETGRGSKGEKIKKINKNISTHPDSNQGPRDISC